MVKKIKMPTIEFKGQKHFVSESQLQEIKQNVTSKPEIKELSGFECVPINLIDTGGKFLIGYLAGKVLDKILFGRTERQV